MKEYVEELAKIQNIFFGIEDHGIMTLSIDLAFEGYNQGFGGYVFDMYDKSTDTRKGNGKAIEFIRNLLEVCKVSELYQLKDKMVYALREINPRETSRNTSYDIKGIKSTPLLGGSEKTFIFEDIMKED